MTGPGWVYVLTHPAWDKLGMVKVGRTGRDPRTRAAAMSDTGEHQAMVQGASRPDTEVISAARVREITSVSGLLAPCTIAWCSPVSDMAAAEQAVHRMLGSHRVRKRRELFRVDTATARGVVEAVAGSLPLSRPPPAALARSVPVRPVAAWRYHPRASRSASWRYGRRRISVPVRVVVGLAAVISWFTLVQPRLGSGWLF